MSQPAKVANVEALNDGVVEAVHLSPMHTMTKPTAARIRLLAGLGVQGDAHLGTKVKHRSRVARSCSAAQSFTMSCDLAALTWLQERWART